jgi:phosphoadenosine phosphosulfate reductase
MSFDRATDTERHDSVMDTLPLPCCAAAATSAVDGSTDALAPCNAELLGLSAPERVAWALRELPGPHVLSSSFGAQSAVLLHMVSRQQPDIPVVLVDTGYLFPETYHFIDQLVERLALNLIVALPQHSPSWYEARHGKLWTQGLAGIERYNQLHKVEPMQKALDLLSCGTWIAGLRRDQSQSRSQLQPLAIKQGRYKLHPLLDWSDRMIGRYLSEHELPYHPLWDQGYVSIGDIHTTRPLGDGMRAEDTRFFGLKRECGLHE